MERDLNAYIEGERESVSVKKLNGRSKVGVAVTWELPWPQGTFFCFITSAERYGDVLLKGFESRPFIG